MADRTPDNGGHDDNGLAPGFSTCWLAQFSSTTCEGRLIVAHILPRQLLKREGHPEAVHDPRASVPACGGITGCSGHHGRLDGYQLTVPRTALPGGTEALAHELGLGWYLDRRFGPVEAVA